MPVFLKIDPNGGTQVLGANIPDATTINDGVMTKLQAQQLATLVAGGGGGGAMMWNIVDEQVGGDTYSAAANDFVPTDASEGNVGVVLPDATTCKGKLVAVKDAVGGSVSVGIKVTTTDSQTIDGTFYAFGLSLSTINRGNDFSAVVFVSNGANWLIAYTYLGQSSD